MVDEIREIDFWVGFREAEGRVLAALQVWKAGSPGRPRGTIITCARRRVVL